MDAKDLLRCLHETETLDSAKKDDGWIFTGYSENHYVSYNIGTRKRKILYMITSINDGREVEFSLRLSINDPLRGCFEDKCKSRHNKEDWIETSRDCCVRKRLPIDQCNDKDKCIQILDDLYHAYNSCVSKWRNDDGKDEVDGCEELPTRPMQPTYQLSWTGWEEYYSYWDGFVKGWFENAADPHDELMQQLKSVFEEANPNVMLDKRELPEPYYGSHKSKCVIVHLNPGASCEGESSKFYGTDGKLINEFVGSCQKKFSDYAEKCSPLTTATINGENVCGYDWWHAPNRINWIRNFFGAEVNEVFALEACPYHSKGWTGGMGYIEKHIISRVITPAIMAAATQEKKCVVFVGNEFNELIGKIKGVEAILRLKGTRLYSLYKYQLNEGEQMGNGSVFLLVINGVQGMNLPGASKPNRDAEKRISEIVGH